MPRCLVRAGVGDQPMAVMERKKLRADWTPQEDELLAEGCENGISLARISVRLKRSIGSVRLRARRLGLQFTSVPRLPVKERRLPAVR